MPVTDRIPDLSYDQGPWPTRLSQSVGAEFRAKNHPARRIGPTGCEFRAVPVAGKTKQRESIIASRIGSCGEPS